MRLLLDTHALIWWVRNKPSLSRAALAAIADPDNDIYVSAISALEIATKVRIGKLPEAEHLARNFEAELDNEGFLALPVEVAHAQLAGNLDVPNKDPFDRVLIAQSILERIPLVSNERAFTSFGVNRVW